MRLERFRCPAATMGVKISKSPTRGWVEALTAVLPHVVTWKTAIVAIGMIVLLVMLRLASEWQRRLTLVALVEKAPGGTVVVQGRGLGGPPMWVQVGNRPVPVQAWQLRPQDER